MVLQIFFSDSFLFFLLPYAPACRKDMPKKRTIIFFSVNLKSFSRLAFAILLCEFAGIVGSFFTMPAIPAWYASLNKPFFSPPNWLFGPVWTTLFALMGISLFLVWQKGLQNKAVNVAVSVFGLQLILNIFWSVLFFGLQNPSLALIEIIALWAAIAFTIKKFYPISRKAAYLLVPYIAWVSIAALLNAAIWLLNA
jgi:tryptophan-rich sensory protein